MVVEIAVLCVAILLLAGAAVFISRKLSDRKKRKDHAETFALAEELAIRYGEFNRAYHVDTITFSPEEAAQLRDTYLDAVYGNAYDTGKSGFESQLSSDTSYLVDEEALQAYNDGYTEGRQEYEASNEGKL